MVKIRSGVAVTGLLAAALATIGVLTAQAAEAPMRQPYAGGVTTVKRAPTALPVDSGSGSRVVYSLSGHRVWLVGPHERVLRTYLVVAGEAGPAPGTHRVFARDAHSRGDDGAPVEHVVLFATSGGANIGFSAAAAPASPRHLATSIRESRADATALWQRAPVGTVVVVTG